MQGTSILGINILLSSPERAALEMLYLIPTNPAYDEAVMLFENLSQLRPKLIQSLLEQCNSIKAKRLFLYSADRFQYPWLTDVNLKQINLGHGKRQIGKGGEYNSKYLLSV